MQPGVNEHFNSLPITFDERSLILPASPVHAAV